MSRIPVRTSLLATGVGLAAIAAIGCGSGDSAPAGAKRMSFELTDAGCKPHDAKAPAGPVVFEVENTGTSKVTEFEVLDGAKVLGEEENLTEGLSGSFDLTLEPGRYTLYCPGGSDERGVLVVSEGSGAAAGS
jgi:iron uptake system component EfeO